MKTRIIIINAAAISLAVISAIAIASAAKPTPEQWPNTPPYTSRYQVIDDMLGMQSRISDLEYRVIELEWLRAHDVQQNETWRAMDLQAWRAARAEDQKRITSLEWNVNALFKGCK
jgi:hypothetical protein